MLSHAWSHNNTMEEINSKYAHTETTQVWIIIHTGVHPAADTPDCDAAAINAVIYTHLCVF